MSNMMQNGIKQKEQDLKYCHQNKCFKDYQIALAQVKAGNNSERLLNEIRQIVCSLYQSKQITKKLYNNIIQYNKGASKYI